MELFCLMIGFLLGVSSMTIVVKHKQKKAVQQMASVGKRAPKEMLNQMLSDDSDVSNDGI